MQVSLEQVAEMAPDPRSAASGKKLLSLRFWEELGFSSEALWGRCRGSSIYQVRVDLSDLGSGCNCPSRKHPCKHVLGLLMLMASNPEAIPDGKPPEWVADWLTKRRQRERKKAEQTPEPKKPVDQKGRKRRTDRREERVQNGIDRLNVWLDDLVRNGIAGLESRPFTFWEDQAKRLVDAQASGLAGRVRNLGEIPGSSRNWPDRMLRELGRLKLLLNAWQRLDHLDEPLQAELRQFVGWNVTQQDLEEQGEPLTDTWIFHGQREEEEERFRTQRTWFVGRDSKRTGLLLQFAAGVQPFPEQVVPGTMQHATMLFYPGASRQRARIAERSDQVDPLLERIPGWTTLDEMLDDFADRLAQLPWLARCGYVLHDVSLVVSDGAWSVRDAAGKGVPLAMRDHWTLLALTGGRPFDLTGEWNGSAFLPLGMFSSGRYRGV